MRATISWWDLSASEQTIESLRGHLRDDLAPWAQVRGLRLKVWISDQRTNCWGAVMLWDADADPAQPLPPNRASELIGYPPTQRLSTDVEALVQGVLDSATPISAPRAADGRTP